MAISRFSRSTRILAPPSSPLHCAQVLQRADGHLDPQNLGLARSFAQLLVRRHALEPLHDVEAPEIGLDRHLLPVRQLARDRERRTQKRIASLHVTPGPHRHLCHQLHVRRVGIDDDVDVLGGTDHPSGAKRKPTDHNELGFRFRQAPENLVEGRLTHRRCAAPAILITA